MMEAIESPAALRRKADKCEHMADRISGDDDANTLRLMAAEYRGIANRLERAALRGVRVDAQTVTELA
jgi:hypothetical protein